MQTGRAKGLCQSRPEKLAHCGCRPHSRRSEASTLLERLPRSNALRAKTDAHLSRGDKVYRRFPIVTLVHHPIDLCVNSSHLSFSATLDFAAWCTNLAPKAPNGNLLYPVAGKANHCCLLLGSCRQKSGGWDLGGVLCSGTNGCGSHKRIGKKKQNPHCLRAVSQNLFDAVAGLLDP